MAEASPATASAEQARKPKDYQPSDAEKRLIKRVEERVVMSRMGTPRWAFDRQMFETIVFGLGIQWLGYDASSQRLTQYKAPVWFPTPVRNEIGPQMAAMMARVLRADPRVRVRPGSNEPQDQEGALVAEKLVSHFDDVTLEDERRQEAALYAVQTGTAIFEDYWDPRAGQVLAIPRTKPELVPVQEPAAVCPQCGYQGEFGEVGIPCPQCSQTLEQGQRPATLPDGSPAQSIEDVPELDEAGQPVVDYVPEGDIATRTLMLFNFYWDQKAKTLRDSRWCGETEYADLAWIEENFPDIGECVGEEGNVEAASFYEGALNGLVGPSIQGTGFQGGQGVYANGAVIRRYQEKPCKQYPKGVYAVVANGVLLYPRPDEQTGELACELPIKDRNGIPTGDFTYTEWRYDVVPGRFAGRTPADDMVSLQRQVNGIGAQKILNRKTLLNPWVLAPKGSGLNAGQTALQPGATLLYNSIGTGATPQVVPGQALPDSVDKETQDCIDTMAKLGQDVQLGATDTPEGMRTGIQVAFIREQKDEVSVPRMKRWARCHAERARKRLLLAGVHYREPRAVKVLGEGSDWQVRAWAGADLRGQTDVVVDAATIVPRSKSATDQLTLDAVEVGLINVQDPIQQQKVIDKLGLVGFDTPIGPDQRRARREHSRMDAGEPVMVNPFDNHQVHQYEHYAIIKDPSFDSKPPEVQQLHLQHAAEHDGIVAQQQAQAQAEEEARRQREKDGGKGAKDGNGQAPPLDTQSAGAESQAVMAA